MKNIKQSEIRDLGIIGDQKTCVQIEKIGIVAWYCPEWFDNKAIFTLNRSYGAYCGSECSRREKSGTRVPVEDV